MLRAVRSPRVSRRCLGSKVLTLLFWATMLSFMGYGAFDPLESLFYRDVLKVGAAWMGWLSALSGVGGLLGAATPAYCPLASSTCAPYSLCCSSRGREPAVCRDSVCARGVCGAVHPRCCIFSVRPH